MFLVTGGNGFVGSALVQELTLRGLPVRSASRAVPEMRINNVEYTVAPILSSDANWSKCLQNITTVIHTAARVHVMKDHSTNALDEYRRVNVEGTISLAEQAARSGVKRFVFLSSIKVNGEETKRDKPYTEADIPMPHDAYGQSKLDAELALHAISIKTGLEIVILRSTMIYGPHVKGNFARLLKIAELGLPLPLRSIDNRRSMISLTNCVDFILCAATHEKARGQIFLMSDNEDLSTPELYARLCKALKRPNRLYPCPKSILKIGGVILNQRSITQRLLCDLQVDITKAKNILGWTPIQSVEEGLALCVNRN